MISNFILFLRVVFGVALGDWSKPSSFLDYLWPVLSGFMQGAAVYFYLFALDKYDASNVTGFENFYPVLVAVISSIFLGERIDLFGYLGIALSTVGAVAISLNMTKVHIPLVSDFVMKHTRKSASEQLCWIERRDPNLSNDDVRCWTPLSLCDANTASSESKRLIDDEERGSQGTHEVSPAPRWLPLVIIIPLIVCVALNVVFTKVAVSDLDSNSVASINFVSFGVLLMLALVVPGSRSNCVAEMKRNWLFALVSQILTCSSLYLIVVAVGRIDASITSALNCLQPVTVLVLERALRFSSESWAECVSYKVVPILFIAVGVTLLTCSVLF